ncbi:MAG: pseudaminic acid cytidylyltransferase [Spirochaetia bacterium]|nr:pseudaminic acid cytidylyltransferase [Spirochaetia bacterium]
MAANICIIPARGGSKRIPRKNIRAFCGRPILEYSVEAALQSGCFDEVMVSTDDPEIAEVARSAGAHVPFLRSDQHSNDHAMTADVLLEVLEAYRAQNRTFEIGCCLYPCAPLVTAPRLKACLEQMQSDATVEGVIPIVPFSYPIQRALTVVDHRVRMIQPENQNIRSQDLVATYHDAGQFYWFRIARFLELGGKSMALLRRAPLVLREMEVQDIDTEEDWEVAELKYRLLMKEKSQ